MAPPKKFLQEHAETIEVSFKDLESMNKVLVETRDLIKTHIAAETVESKHHESRTSDLEDHVYGANGSSGLIIRVTEIAFLIKVFITLLAPIYVTAIGWVVTKLLTQG